MASHAKPQRSGNMQKCIQACLSCHTICLETITYCLTQGGKHAEAKHIRLLLDCAQICQTSADFMMRDSDLHTYTCAACAEVCLRCADSCDQMSNDAQMQACAEACRRCAEACEQMAIAV